MSTATPTQSQQLVSLITRGGTLEVRLDTVPLPAPQPDDLIVRIEAAPINPSDLGLLLGAADLSTLEASGTAEAPVLRAQVPACRFRRCRSMNPRDVGPVFRRKPVQWGTGR